MKCPQKDIIILLTLFIFMNANLRAQQVRVKASVDRTTILIGEPIKLTLEATAPTGTSIKWFKTDTIPHFEFVEKSKIDSSIDVNNKIYRQQLVITSFDSGYWRIPAFVLQSGRKRFRTDTFAINVTFSPTDTARDYHDIKDIIAVKNPGNPYIPWIIAAATLLALLGIIYFLRKRKRPAVAAPKAPASKLSPLEEAMQMLESIRKERLPEKGEVKQYYTRLNDTLRMYMLRKFNFSSHAKTNEELIMHLRQMRLGDMEYTSLAQTLRMVDFVKFAKYVPSAAEQEDSFNVIKNSISRLDATSASA